MPIGRPTYKNESRIQQSLLQLIPRTGRIQSSELRRQAALRGFSTRTLYKYMKKWEPYLVRRIVDEDSIPPRVFYERAPLAKAQIDVGRARRIVLARWTRRKEKERDAMYLAFSFFINRLINAILEACEYKDEAQARDYFDVITQAWLSSSVHDLFALCLGRRNIRVDGVPVLSFVADSFMPGDETQEWIRRYAPEWAKPFIGRLPEEMIVQILVSVPSKQAAVREIQDETKRFEQSTNESKP